MRRHLGEVVIAVNCGAAGDADGAELQLLGPSDIPNLPDGDRRVLDVRVFDADGDELVTVWLDLADVRRAIAGPPVEPDDYTGHPWEAT